jgi:hypothetical protein
MSAAIWCLKKFPVNNENKLVHFDLKKIRKKKKPESIKKK